MRALYLLIILTTFSIAPVLAEVTGVVVVRHAEKADDGTRDPGLTAAGQARAQALASALEQANIGALIASQYQRTQQTLAALARERGLEVAVVPAESGGIEAHIQAIASMVREFDGDGLLVIAGHSNTVPLIVEALSGRVVAPIDESEYDRLFVLLPEKTGMQVVATRYGQASAPKEE